jgi:RNA polymerase sigma-70 factor (ECF subfamily)
MEQAQFVMEILPFRERLVVYANRLLENKEDAEDIIQEVFIKLWQIRHELCNYNSPYALSVTITKRLCINRLKVYQRREKEPCGFILTGKHLSPDIQLEQKEGVAHLFRIIDQLPSLQQAIIRMKHVDGLQVAEIAALTGSNPKAIRMNLSRARKKMKELFLKNNSQ